MQIQARKSAWDFVSTFESQIDKGTSKFYVIRWRERIWRRFHWRKAETKILAWKLKRHWWIVPCLFVDSMEMLFSLQLGCCCCWSGQGQSPSTRFMLRSTPMRFQSAPSNQPRRWRRKNFAPGVVCYQFHFIFSQEHRESLSHRSASINKPNDELECEQDSPGARSIAVTQSSHVDGTSIVSLAPHDSFVEKLCLSHYVCEVIAPDLRRFCNRFRLSSFVCRLSPCFGIFQLLLSHSLRNNSIRTPMWTRKCVTADVMNFHDSWKCDDNDSEPRDVIAQPQCAISDPKTMSQTKTHVEISTGTRQTTTTMMMNSNFHQNISSSHSLLRFHSRKSLYNKLQHQNKLLRSLASQILRSDSTSRSFINLVVCEVTRRRVNDGRNASTCKLQFMASIN